ncbi:hypothetical protein Vqi01_43520 [Micromonospora qiuiae]|uniref:Uncharacterized protein n=1 Tax=Micromonospora qiuiae TaxID=502268 RepID=A0ABQ4JIB2_9ACTN|nr:hypothetical protein [Micromonospora qiuiae]GIJ29190.1 hypothetical protein Vqi01_43520 [Micromonospora qiuiae]
MERIPGWPSAWAGTWVAPDGKTVRLIHEDCGITVTVSPDPDQPPYQGVERVPGTCHVDEQGRRYLEVEAGVPGIGPTYRLYAAVEGVAGLSIAPADVDVDRLVLHPSTSIGLYDDWEDDLGVPWAYPLESLRWQAK